MCFSVFSLELETGCQLDLTLTEECTVSSGNAVEATRAAAKVKCRTRVRQSAGSADGIDSGANTSDLGAIEEIEPLSDQFQFRALCYAEPA